MLGVFKPKDGVREKLRETLHNVLEVEMAERAKEIKLEEEGVTDAPNTVTISKNTRYEAEVTAVHHHAVTSPPAALLHDYTTDSRHFNNIVTIKLIFVMNFRVEENRQRESSRNFVSRARKLPISSEVSQDSNRLVCNLEHLNTETSIL